MMIREIAAECFASRDCCTTRISTIAQIPLQSTSATRCNVGKCPAPAATSSGQHFLTHSPNPEFPVMLSKALKLGLQTCAPSQHL